MLKNEENQKLKFFKPSDLAWNAPYTNFADYQGGGVIEIFSR